MLKKVRVPTDTNCTLGAKQVWHVYSAQELLSYSQNYENIKHSIKVAAEQESCAQCISLTLSLSQTRGNQS